MATTWTLQSSADLGDKKCLFGVLTNAASAMSAADTGMQHIDMVLVAAFTGVHVPQYSVSGGSITLAVQSGASYGTFPVMVIGW